MNNKLKKTPKKKADYQKRYMKTHKKLCICLDKTEDEDIIEWMSEQPSITASVKRILRWEINGRDDYTDGSTEREAPAGDPEAEGSQQENQIETSKDRLPEADPEDGKRTEDIRPSAAEGCIIKICSTCREGRVDNDSETCYCNNEESEKAGQQTALYDTCSAWR